MAISKFLMERILEKKKRLDSLRPLPKDALARLRHDFNIELTYNSNAIEGNTLTLQETRLAIEEGITSGEKPLTHYLEAVNHEKAIEFVEGLGSDRKINEELVLEIHELILKGTTDYAGRYRDTRVTVGGAGFLPPDPDSLLGEMKKIVEWVKKGVDDPDTEPLEFAAMAHYKLVRIHPFVDGNGRVSRLIMNLILIRNGFPPAMLLYTDRKKYYDVLRQADKGNFTPFLNFVARSVEQSLSRYLNAMEKPSAENKLMSLAEAIQFCDYSQEYLSLLARKGRLGATKIGGDWMVSKEELKRYIDSLK